MNDPFELRPLIDFKGTAEELRGEIDARITKSFGTVDGVLTMIEKQQALDPNFPLRIPVPVVREVMARNPELGKQLLTEMQRHKADVLEQFNTAAHWELRWEEVYKVLGETFGIFSLTEDPIHILMWSHYASQHNGVVVEFDENHPWFHQKRTANDEFCELVPVSYLSNPHPRTFKQLNGADLLYTKSAEWSYEREWRIIRPLRDGSEVSPGKFCFDVPPEAVRCIVFGCRTKSEVEKEIRDAVKANSALSHVSFKRAVIQGGKLQLEDAK